MRAPSRFSNASSMHRCRPLVWLLVLALCWAQYAGAVHRIEHAAWHGETHAAFAGQPPSGGDAAEAHHSCVAFDAAFAGAHPPCAELIWRPARFAQPDWIAPPSTSWPAPAPAHQYARAPPPSA